MSEAPRTVDFVLLGETRRALLERTLAERMQQWWSRWSAVDAGSLVLHADPQAQESARRILDGTACAVFEVSLDGTPGLCVAIEGNLLPAMLGLGVGVPDPWASHATLRELQREVITCLVRTCIASPPHQRIELDDDGRDRARQLARAARQGRCVPVLATCHRIRIVFLLHPHVLDAIAARRSVSVEGRPIPRKRALDAEPVRVEAILGEAEVNLQDLAGLKPGHVIVLNQPLSQPGYLAMPDGRRLANVAIGASEASRAVSVTK